MTDRQLMKLALEALDWAAGCIEPLKPINCDCPVCWASDALRERLAQPEQLKLSCGVDYDAGLLTVSVVRGCADGSMEVIHCEQIAMPIKAQPQRTHWEGCEEVHPECRKPEQQRPPNCGTSYYSCIECVMESEKRLPRREWVGLTDDDLKPVCDEYRILFGGWVHDFARAIEAKLKEKNA